MSPRPRRATPAPRGRGPQQAAEQVVDRYFFDHLRNFYLANRGSIRRSYKELTKQFLDHNDPAKNKVESKRPAGAEQLRKPQFEALEMYVFLKEYAGNRRVFEIFDAWFNRGDGFENRADLGTPNGQSRQGNLLAEQDALELAAWAKLFGRMKAAAHATPTRIPANAPSPPPNYIFALSMGVGKTRLMGVCILYEFLLARKFPKDVRYAHNAVVFAPDTTVREALREIELMDFGSYLPPQYANVLPAEIHPRVLDDDVTALELHDGGDFHIVISNVQKIIRKKKHKEPSAGQQLLLDVPPQRPERTGLGAEADALADAALLEEEADLLPNQRFEKLLRAPNLAIYIDEAHHAFGKGLAGNLGQKFGRDGQPVPEPDETAFRRTVRMLIDKLDRAKSRVVGTYCYTGTPYADGVMFPEVVYHYGLRAAIDERHLKLPVVRKFKAVLGDEFVKQVISGYTDNEGKWHPGFIELTGAKERRYEGMRPKLAFFARDIDDAKELRAAVENVIAAHGFSPSAVLLNTSDEATTSKDDVLEFKRLDTFGSDKQFIILVGKGKEGWNCRSLFGVALHREPTSAVFVLQATMRCLRAIDAPHQHTGYIFVSEPNAVTLDAELRANFRLALADFGDGKGRRGEPQSVRPLPPTRPIRLRRIRYHWDLANKAPQPNQDLGLAKLTDADLEKYLATVTEVRNPFTPFEDKRFKVEVDVTASVQAMQWSAYTLVGECARYLHRPPTEIDALLRSSLDGVDRVVELVNRYNNLLYDHVIPALFKALFDLRGATTTTEEVPIDLAPVADDKFWTVHANPALVVRQDHSSLRGIPDLADRTFHLDTYCFDSGSEQRTFFDLVKHKHVRQIYFTGMLTAGQTDFCIQYIDSSGHTVRSYYPDFVVEQDDGSWIIVEVKGNHLADKPNTKDKARAARESASESGMRYAFLPSSLADAGKASLVLDPGALDDDGRIVDRQIALP